MKKLKYIIVLFLLSSCGAEELKQEQKAIVKDQITLNETQVKNAGVLEGYPQKKKIGFTINATGAIDVAPQYRVTICPKMSGFVKSINLIEGAKVSKNQVLLTLEHPDFIQIQQDYLEVIAKLPYLQEEMERQKLLVEQEASNKKALQMAQSEWAVYNAKKTGLKEKLELLGISISKLNNGTIQKTVSILSPIDGVVSSISAELGAFVDPSHQLLEVIDAKHCHAELRVFEKDIPKLKIGQEVELKVTSTDKIIKAKTVLIGGEIGDDQTVSVHCELENTEEMLLPGTYLNAVIKATDTEAFCIPSKAVVDLKGKKVIFAKTASGNGTATFMPFEIEVLQEEEEFTAFTYKNNKRNNEDILVVSGAYDILSQLVIQEGNE